jgi:hypothetical protein
MNIVLSKDTYDNQNIYFGKKITNNIIPNSYFYNIYYSNEMLHINNVMLQVTLNNVTICEYFNKFKCCFNVNENKQTIQYLKDIETSILDIFNNNLQCDNKLSEQLDKCEIKINNFSNKKLKQRINKLDIIIKISGVWETDNEKGLIVKFIV